MCVFAGGGGKDNTPLLFIKYLSPTLLLYYFLFCKGLFIRNGIIFCFKELLKCGPLGEKNSFNNVCKKLCSIIPSLSRMQFLAASFQSYYFCKKLLQYFNSFFHFLLLPHLSKLISLSLSHTHKSYIFNIHFLNRHMNMTVDVRRRSGKRRTGSRLKNDVQYCIRKNKHFIRFFLKKTTF